MQFLLSLVLTSIAVMLAAFITPGATVDSFITAVLVALVLGFLNAVVKPILMILTLPINILTLGLFSVVINLIILLLVEALVPGFALGGFLAVILFALVLTVINGILANMAGDSKKA